MGFGCLLGAAEQCTAGHDLCPAPRPNEKTQPRTATTNGAMRPRLESKASERLEQAHYIAGLVYVYVFCGWVCAQARHGLDGAGQGVDVACSGR